jgi:hypothetical protein
MVAERPRKSFLLHDVDSALPSIYSDCDETAGGIVHLTSHFGGSKQVSGRRYDGTPRDDPE